MAEPKGFTVMDAAYLAGLIDGDGYVGILRRRTRKTRSGFSYYAEMDLSSVHPTFLQEIQSLVGAGCWRRVNRGFKSQRPLYHLKMGPNALRWLLPLLIPHMKLKRRQAIIVLEHLGTMAKGRHGQSPASEARYLELRKMNHRGSV